MSDNRGDAAKSQSGRWARLALMSAATTAVLMYQLAAPGEAPRAAVLFLECVLLAGSVIGLGGALLMLMLGK
jgi:hypothetical protein